MLSAAGFAATAAPWAQAAGNAAPSPSGQPDTWLFEAITGAEAHDAMPLAGGPLDTVRSAATAGSAGVASPVAPPGSRPPPPLLLSRHRSRPLSTRPRRARGASRKPAARQQAAKPKAHAAPARPYLVYDSVKPETLPHGKAAAVYVNGAYAAFPRQLGGLRSVLWIDTNGSDPAANVLDVEPGDATPAGAAHWVKQRLSLQPHSVAIVYTMRNDWQQVKDHVAALPGWMQSKVRYWIADPTGVPHVVAGSSATQWYWGKSYDVTTANPDFVG